MRKIDKENQVQPADGKSWKSVMVNIINICEEVGVYMFHFRKLLLGLPVVFASIYLARVNWTQLPDQVGLSLMANGQFARLVEKEVAVYGPMGVTAVCLLLMVCSRRALYPWLISVFTLVLPVLILITNIFPS
jgi:hypothetical protein